MTKNNRIPGRCMSRFKVFELLCHADSEVRTELLAEHGPNTGALKPETASSIGQSQTENLIRHDGDVHKTVPSEREKCRNAIRAWLRERAAAQERGARPPPCGKFDVWGEQHFPRSEKTQQSARSFYNLGW